jgi:3-isopropylmalate/(R)-2-methylmalate dehydratase large subunit
MSKTLFDKVWDSHVVRKIEDGPDVFFIDRHFIHEVTSPVAFLGLKTTWPARGKPPRCCYLL